LTPWTRGFISIDVFGTAIIETGRNLSRYVTNNDLKKDAIGKVVEGASSENWVPQLLGYPKVGTLREQL
jgi:hypothetical protein